RRDSLLADIFGLAPIRQIEVRPSRIPGDSFKRLSMIAQEDELRPVERAGGVAAAENAPNLNQPFRFAIRHSAHQHPVDNRKYRRVRPDSERQRENSDQSKAGFLQQHSRAVAQVLPECLHHTSPFSQCRSTIGVTGESAAVLKPNAVPAQPALQRLKIAGFSPRLLTGASANVRFWHSAIPILGSNCRLVSSVLECASSASSTFADGTIT